MSVNNRLVQKFLPITALQVGMLLVMWWGLAVAMHAEPLPGPLVDTQWLADNLSKVVILDVRENEDSFEKKAEPPQQLPVNPCGARKSPEDKPFIVSGHIPGAVMVPLKEVVVKRKVGDVELKAMLPTKENFDKLMQKSGVNNDSAVVITSLGMTPNDMMITTRLYWSLKYFGHDNVAVLNGGTAQWVKDGRDTEYGKSEPKKGEFKATAERQEMLATAADVMKVVKGENKTEQLIDVRGEDLYLGLTYPAKYVQPHGQGHIPGAKNFPVYFMTNAAGPIASIYNKENILKVAEVVGVDLTKPTIAYCSTGVQASVGWFVWHELLGNKNVRLYDGSMHEWSMNADNPVTAMKVE